MEEKAKVERAVKVREAVQRMQALAINQIAIEAFTKHKLIPICFNSVDKVYGLEPKNVDRIKNFEEQHNALVYFVIFTPTNFGDMESYLFVSDYEEEWEMDNEDIKDGYAMTWTENLTHPECSEFGSISFAPTESGGLKRIGIDDNPMIVINV